MDRRGVFFVTAGGVCALLVPAAPADLRWVPERLAIAYAVLALASFADAWSHGRAETKGTQQADAKSGASG